MVYIREAHALDSMSPMGGGRQPILEDPSTLTERRAVAELCMTKMALEPMRAVVDGLDDATNRAYGAWPDRLYLIDVEGRVSYRGRPGPMGFKPDELEAAIRAELELD